MFDQKFTEKGTVEVFPGKAAWFYIKLPKIYTEMAKEFSQKKFAPITATVGNTTWVTAILPFRNGESFIALKASVRKIENIKAGDKIEVSFTFKI